MPENLWKLRARKGYSVPQLAAKSGIPQQLLFEYEQGKPLKPADQARLAKALYVQPSDIALVSAPQPASTQGYNGSGAGLASNGVYANTRPVHNHVQGHSNGVVTAPRPSGPANYRSGPPRFRGKPIEDRNAIPARESQIKHLAAMAVSRGHDLAQLVATVGKPLESLTAAEATKWNIHYKDLPRVPKAKGPEGQSNGAFRRAALPEGLDRFEYSYLAEVKDSNDTLSVMLFNGEQVTGRLIGFGLYTFTLMLPNEQEMTIQKLAIAYYSRGKVAPAASLAGAADAQDAMGGAA